MFTEKEQGTIAMLYRFLKRNPGAILNVEFEGQPPFEAVKDTSYETDNGLELGEEGYEEFYAILLQRIDNKELIELTYLHFPVRITCNGEFVAGTAATSGRASSAFLSVQPPRACRDQDNA